MKNPKVAITALVVGALASLALYNVLKSYSPTTETAGELTEIGSVQKLTGLVESRKPKALKFETLAPDALIYHGEMILTQNASQAVLSFKGGASVELHPASRLVAEFDPATPDAVIATLVEGSADVLSMGRTNSFRLFQDGREVKTAGIDIPVVGITDVAEPAATPDEIVDSIVEESLPEAAPSATPNAPTTKVELGSVLSNEEIRHRLRSQTGFFQRCFLNFINRAPGHPLATKGGVVTVSFVIQSNGKTRDSKLVRSDFTDSVLNNCIVETIGRTSFRGFSGDEIPILEFPISLK